jgi:uncharacterized repeat protein (TIGR03803 family)
MWTGIRSIARHWTAVGVACYLSFCAAAVLLTTSYALAEFTALHNFNIHTDGRPHDASSLAVWGTTIFGTCYDTGFNGEGTIWSWDTNTHSFSKLHDFKRSSGDGGYGPLGGITVVDSTIFGTTLYGGTYDEGTVWSFDTNEKTFAKLHDFKATSDGRAANVDIAVVGSNIFGTAGSGGKYDRGTIWSFDTNEKTFTKLHDFGQIGDGVLPKGSVAVVGTNIYGTAEWGGSNGGGTIWSFDTATSTYTNLYHFQEGTATAASRGVTVSGTTLFGISPSGDDDRGTLWSYDLGNNTFAVLHEFTGGSDGARPWSNSAVSGTTFIGTAEWGGANDDGTIWSFDTHTKVFTKLFDFTEATGKRPISIVLSGNTLYGMNLDAGLVNTDEDLRGTLWSFTVPELVTIGDFNGNGVQNAEDIDLLSAAIRDNSTDPQFDVDGDGWITTADHMSWVKDLRRTWIGDANLDGEFNSTDLIDALAAGTYEMDVAAGWASGDFNADWRFNSSDLIDALADGGYEQGPLPPSAAAVPEPQACTLLTIGLVVALCGRRTCREI